MADDYSGSGYFVGESTAEPSAPAPAKKSTIQERKVTKTEARNPDTTEVANNVTNTLNSMGPVNPPIGEVISGVAKQAGNFIGDNLGTIAGVAAGAGGLYAAWRALHNNNPPDDNNPPNNPPNNKWDKTVAGRPANAKLGSPAPTENVPTLTALATPTAPAAPAAPTSSAPSPAATFPAQATQQPLISGYKPATGNIIEGVPNPIMGSAPAPAEIAPAPVKPLDPLVQAKIDALAETTRRQNEEHANTQRRADELHQTKLANETKRAEAILQNIQGKSASLTNADAQASQLIVKSEENKLSKAVEATKQKPPVVPAASAPAPAVTPAPVTAPPAAPAATPEAAPAATTLAAPAATKTTPPATEPATTTATTKEPVKPPKWPGGAEGSAVQQLFGGTKKTLEPKHMAALEMFKDYVGGPLTMPATGGSIHQIDKANTFVEKYSGAPLPRTEDGKLARLPEEQIQKIHTGIQNELQDAVKNNKLGNLSKGAMAAVALLGLTNAVQAAQKGDFGPLGEAGFFNLAGKLIGGTATAALTPTEAGAPTVGNTKEQQKVAEVSQRPGVRAYAEMLKNRLSGEEYNKAISDFAATNPKRGDYAAMQELFRQQAANKKRGQPSR
jgi:hypothetical protein